MLVTVSFEEELEVKSYLIFGLMAETMIKAEDPTKAQRAHSITD